MLVFESDVIVVSIGKDVMCLNSSKLSVDSAAFDVYREA
jgi:hypothetical protein